MQHHLESKVLKLTVEIGYDSEKKMWYTTGECDFCKCFPCEHIDLERDFLGIRIKASHAFEWVRRRLRISYRTLTYSSVSP